MPAEDSPTPDLTVVISTHFRPEPVRRAIQAIRDQDYDGIIETIVVFDKEDPDTSLESNDGRRPVSVLANSRTPGLPGSRNTGAAAARAPIVGFSDDDDVWLPTKARKQLNLLQQTGAPVVGCSIEIAAPDRVVVRPSFGSAVRIEDMVLARIPEASMCTVLVRKEAFFGPIGPVEEQIPGGFAEDYDFWVRATRHAPVPLVQEPLYRVHWDGVSYFRDRWDTMDTALAWMIETHPEFHDSKKGLARIQAQRSFAKASAGDRRGAWKLFRTAFKLNPIEQRLPFVGLVLVGISGEKVMYGLNRIGRGI